MNKKYIYYIILILIAVGIVYFIPKQTQAPEITGDIKDFEACTESGGEIIPGTPTVCKTSDGRTFAEEGRDNPEVIIDTPKFGDVITSPVTVKGRARGFWFFEANIPLTLKDQTGKVLAQKGFMSTGDWMTENYVEFEGLLEFTATDAEFGVLIIAKDNPSGLPELDAEYAIPVRFR